MLPSVVEVVTRTTGSTVLPIGLLGIALMSLPIGLLGSVETASSIALMSLVRAA